MKRVDKALLIGMVMVALAIGLAGCGGTESSSERAGDVETTDSSSIALLPVKVGTLATDDLLPLWVAQQEGFLTQAGLDVEIITFQSPMESRAAMTAGEIDGLMTDMVVAAQLTASEGARAVTVMQTAPAGILASPKSNITSLEGLAQVPIGISSPTVMEFIADKALSDAGVADEAIAFEIIEKLPVRLEMLMSNQVQAAVLPWTLFQLAQQQGAVPLLDEAKAAEYTSTVLVFRDGFLTQAGAGETIAALLGAWGRGVESINANPDSFRTLLVEKANLPEPLKETYRIRTYPQTGTPPKAQFEAVVDWMVKKGYLDRALAFEDLVYQP